jgi:hypothetical protein
LNESIRCLIIGTPRTYFREETKEIRSETCIDQRSNRNQRRKLSQHGSARELEGAFSKQSESSQQSAIRVPAWELRAEKTDARGGASSCLIARVIYV